MEINLSQRHEKSDSDCDSDKTISEDEMAAISGGKYKAAMNIQPERNSKKMNADNRPVCKYGRDCYRKNPQHLRDFKHPSAHNQDETETSDGASPEKKCKRNLDVDFYLNTVNGISPSFNQRRKALGIKDILSKSNGSLIGSVQFNYMFEFPWLCEQYPAEFRHKPLLIVHGEQREAKRSLEQQVARFSNISLCQAPLEIPFGTHHTKMMFLLYEEGIRIVIHTSNLISQDWHQKTQGIWLSPIFPKLKEPPSVTKGDSCTFFKRDLLDYLIRYKAHELTEWFDHIKGHDFTSARVYIIGSVPGRHTGGQKMLFGHLKLRKVLQEKGPDQAHVNKRWPVIGQFSSIGSLGPNPNQWLTKEWLTSTSSTQKSSASESDNLILIFPSVDNVRMSLEGYPAGGSLPYSVKTAQKQPWLRDFLHAWKSNCHGRTNASPHIKTYLRASPDYNQVAWMLITSANLSKAAWGALEKKDSQLMIRSYELGVLFLPQMFDKSYFDGQSSSTEYFIPFDLPPTPYKSDDQPWMWDVPHTKAPDRHGMMWTPN